MNVQEELEKLYRQIDDCKRCPLGNLDVNKPPRLRLKEGTKPIFIVSQNPSVIRDTSRLWVWGGLDALPYHFFSIIENEVRKCWISNLVKCASPQNRCPKASEVKACLPFLKEEIRIIQPQKIIALGKPTSKWLRRLGYNILVELPHPAYVSRFKFGDLEAYISKLKKAIV